MPCGPLEPFSAVCIRAPNYDPRPARVVMWGAASDSRTRRPNPLTSPLALQEGFPFQCLAPIPAASFGMFPTRDERVAECCNMSNDSSTKSVLAIGIDPAYADLSALPGYTPDMVRAYLEA